MLTRAVIVACVILVVAVAGIAALSAQVAVGPTIVLLSLVPLTAILVSGRTLAAAVPDIVFGSIDTGLLAIPALWGGLTFGVAGAVTGAVVGDAMTDGVAGFFEGYAAEWLRRHGFAEARESVTTSLGKMSGCLFGSGLVLSAAWLAGVDLSML